MEILERNEQARILEYHPKQQFLLCVRGKNQFCLDWDLHRYTRQRSQSIIIKISHHEQN
jgi:hypothetical protein